MARSNSSISLSEPVRHGRYNLRILIRGIPTAPPAHKRLPRDDHSNVLCRFNQLTSPLDVRVCPDIPPVCVCTRVVVQAAVARNDAVSEILTKQLR